MHAALLSPMTSTDDDAMTIRHDDDPQPVKITREIPLWGLLLALAAIGGQALLMWAGQREQSIAIGALKAQIVDATTELRKVSGELGTKNLKDVEHDIKLGDLERRMQTVEGRRP